MIVTPKRSNLFLLSLLGSLSVVSPFAIDLYLPAIQELAAEFGVSPSTISDIATWKTWGWLS